MKINRENFEKMDQEIEIRQLALANILDLIPLIANTGEEVDPVILRSYEHNAAVLDQLNENQQNHELVHDQLNNVL